MAKKEVVRFFTELGGKSLIEDIKASERLLDRYNRRYTPRKRNASSWRAVGLVERVIPYERGVRFACQNGWVELHWIAPDCLRVRLRPSDGDFIEPFSYAVNKVDWPIVDYEILEGPDALEIRTAGVVCRIGKRPFRIGLETLDGKPICLDMMGMQSRAEGGARLSLAMQPDEASYGLGERASNLQLRGKKFAFWNTDPAIYARGSDPLYYNIPFYLGVHRHSLYGVFWDNSSRGSVDVGASKLDEMIFEAESGELRYYLFAGADVKSVLGRYTELTGRIKLPPLWSLGYHQSRFSYESEDVVVKMAKAFREHGIPCDVIYLDIHYMDAFRVFTWDSRRFSRFRQMINVLHQQGFKVVVVVDPSVKVEPQYSAYQSGLDHNVFLKFPDGQSVNAATWPGLSCFPDFTNPAARAWWAEQISGLIRAGVDGIWNNMGEPAIFTLDGPATLPDYVVHNQDGLESGHLENHNVYGMLMGRASQEGFHKARPDRRPYNVIRAGFAGAQRYASSWTGENVSDWDHLRLSISMVLNMGLSGAHVTGPDVGGFQKDTNGELLTRWLQAACLMPFSRSNTAMGTQAQEPWAFGQPYEVINRLTIELRYRLMPYLYSVVALSKEYGWPIIRPLFMAEPDNPEIRAIDDCYLLGDALLVAPVVTPGAVKRTVYLPIGRWYDYWTNEELEGGQYVTVPAPLERLPLFVRAGAVIPCWPEMQFTGEREIETLLYRVYPGDFETVLYEDRGEGFEYEKGDYRWVYITCEWDDSKFVIDRRIAGRYVPVYKNLKLEILGFDEEPLKVRIDRQGAPLWFYDDGLLELTIDNFQRMEITRKSLPTDRTVVRRPW